MARESEAVQALRRSVGQRLSVLRRAAGLTQSELAARTYCHRTQVAHLERGTGGANEQLWKALDDAVDAGGLLYVAAMDISRQKLKHEQLEIEQTRASFQKEVEVLRQQDVEESWTPRESHPPPNTQPGPSHTNVERSQQTWHQIRTYLSRHRTRLTQQAADLYNRDWRVMTTPTLTREAWLPHTPVPLHDVTLTWADDPLPPL